MEMSISLHVGNAVNVGHNNRTLDKYEVHIDYKKSNQNIYYKKGSVMDVYNSVEVKEAVKEYNSKQKQKCRRIDNYYNKVKNDKRVNEKMEAVIAIGEAADGDAYRAVKGEMLNRFVPEFIKNNPQLHVYNAVLHMDEANPHLHITYVPLAKAKGKMPIKVGNSDAIKQQMQSRGVECSDNSEYFTQWLAEETAILEGYMLENGITRKIIDKDEPRDYLTPDEMRARGKAIKALEAREEAVLEREEYAQVLETTLENRSINLKNSRAKLDKDIANQDRIVAAKVKKLNESYITELDAFKLSLDEREANIAKIEKEQAEALKVSRNLIAKEASVKKDVDSLRSLALKWRMNVNNFSRAEALVEKSNDYEVVRGVLEKNGVAIKVLE